MTLATRYRYVTLAVALGSLLIAGGAVVGGRVSFYFFPSPEPDRIYVNLEMVAGTAREETAATLGLPEGTVLSRLSRAMKKLEARLQPWTEAQ